MKILHKLLLSFFIITSLIGVAGYLSITEGKRILTECIVNHSDSLAREILDQIDRTIYSRIEALEDYSNSVLLRQAVKDSNLRFQVLDHIQADIDKIDKEWTLAPKEEITTFMQELMGNKLSRDLQNKVFFYKKKYGYSLLGEIFVTNRFGANIGQTSKTTDYRQNDEKWWQRATADGLSVSDVKYDKSSNMYSTDIAIRIDDENGNFIGVMKAVLNIDASIGIIKQVRENNSGEWRNCADLYLTTSDGKIIYSTKTGNIIGNIVHLQKHAGYIVRKDSDAGKGKVLSIVARSKGYKDFRGFGWMLVIDHRIKDIFSPIIQMKSGILIILSAVTILAFFISILFSRSIVDPILKLRDAAIDIGRGNLDTPIGIESKNEIGQLADSFRKMTRDLSETTTSIRELDKEIVHRKRAEKALRESKESMENALEQLKDTQAQMIQSEKMASIGQLAAGVAHEINNPIGFVSCNVNMLSDYQSDIDKLLKTYRKVVESAQEVISTTDGNGYFSEQMRRVQAMEAEIDINFILNDVHNLIRESLHGIERIRKIVADLKDFAHPGNGDGLQTIDINNCLDSTLNVVWNEIKYKATVTKDYGEIPMVECYPHQINQVFANILVNAAQAIEEQGDIKITTRAHNGDVEVRIKDSGSGISQKNIGKIFDPFFTTKEVGKGTGLGLNLSYNIIKKHHGDIHVESEVEGGTTFIVRLSLTQQKNNGVASCFVIDSIGKALELTE